MIASWLVPALMTLIGTGISAGMQAKSSKEALAQQEKAQEIQNNNARMERENNERLSLQTQEENNRNYVAQFKNTIVPQSATVNSELPSATIANVGNSNNGYLNEDTFLARLGGVKRFINGGSYNAQYKNRF